MASILRRGDSYSVRFKYKDHAGRICEGWERVLLVVPYLGKKQIQKVQTYDLEQFYATLSRTPRGLYKQGVKQTLTDKQKRQFLTGASIREVHAMLKTAFSYAVEWGLLLKSPIPREAPKSTSEERAIWDEKTMLAALQTMTDPTLHLACLLYTSPSPRDSH